MPRFIQAEGGVREIGADAQLDALSPADRRKYAQRRIRMPSGEGPQERTRLKIERNRVGEKNGGVAWMRRLARGAEPLRLGPSTPALVPLHETACNATSPAFEAYGQH
jgi:hypothetical protein